MYNTPINTTKVIQMARYTITAKQGNKIVHRYETDDSDAIQDMLDTYLENYSHLKIEMIDTKMYCGRVLQET